MVDGVPLGVGFSGVRLQVRDCCVEGYGEVGCGVRVQGRKVWADVEVVEEQVAAVHDFNWVFVVDFQREEAWDWGEGAVYHAPIADGCVVQRFGVDVGEVALLKRFFVHCEGDVGCAWWSGVNHGQLADGSGFGRSYHVQRVGSVNFRPVNFRSRG